jgi:hypothetical protein
LTNISDKERLNVLKEVAGTKVYEKKRLESVKIMDETGELPCLVHGDGADKQTPSGKRSAASWITSRSG